MVSVVIPCFRQAHFLARAIESVLAQTETRFEIIVVNDGSDDNTEEVVKSFAADSRIRYVHQRNQGLSAARNTGLQHATGDWIQFLDADDLLHPHKFQAQLENASDEVDVVYSDYQCFAADDLSKLWKYSTAEFTRKSAFESLVTDWENGLSIPPHSFLFRRSFIEAFGGFDRELPNHEDWHWHLRLAAKNARFCYLPECHAYYRVTPVSMSRGAASEAPMRRGKYLCLERVMESPELQTWQRRLVMNRYVADRTADFAAEIRKGKVSTAASCLWPMAFSSRFRSVHLMAYTRILASVAGWLAFRWPGFIHRKIIGN